MSLSTQTLKIVLISNKEEEFGLPIHYVASIERVTEITPMPEMPQDVTGVIHLRDNVIPIIDFGQLIGNQNSLQTDSSRIVVLQNDDIFLGLLTEAATDVIDIDPTLVQTPGNFAHKEDSLIQGVAKHKDRLIVILNCPVIYTNSSV
ncbi:chemotaxis protein CheW [Fictibacillus phosphorivorans]|uniref:chemotaxis protein CheW n=1 Tax=Fictibacillus phosphorivorans TaxID=1221500 RepID=UPI00203D054E|nr:chemotaxis protein CheW [Fictibacillus phosphorivorans]MCM3717375.1 chemotaxis protein CheW [Fictibacillus phosphorivorans]MCM3775070.1 chemotaxis protein CheW [Fictibacillus phosphorivorans]